MRWQDPLYTLNRPGIMLYGYPPQSVKTKGNFIPVMELTTKSDAKISVEE